LISKGPGHYAEMYISTLRGFVGAVGGELALVVRLPKRPMLRSSIALAMLPTPHPGRQVVHAEERDEPPAPARKSIARQQD
jgi:hypothetical protein